MENFRTKVDLDVSMDLSENHDVVTKNFDLNWNLELEMRQYGIKSFIVTVPDQLITVYVNLWGEDSDDEKPVLLHITDVLIERNEFLDSFVPKSLEFYKGQWKLVF